MEQAAEIYGGNLEPRYLGGNFEIRASPDAPSRLCGVDVGGGQTFGG